MSTQEDKVINFIETYGLTFLVLIFYYLLSIHLLREAYIFNHTPPKPGEFQCGMPILGMGMAQGLIAFIAFVIIACRKIFNNRVSRTHFWMACLIQCAPLIAYKFIV